MKYYVLLVMVLLTGSLNMACTHSSANRDKPVHQPGLNNTGLNDIPKLFTGLNSYSEKLTGNFTTIPEARRIILNEVATELQNHIDQEDTTNLIFICTHNSRRSHMSQIWAQAASYYYGIPDVKCFSGGTEVTAFNTRSVKALQKAGFEILKTDSSSNPVYLVSYSRDAPPIEGFSKKYNDGYNPKDNFIAIMTCSHADETCPLIFGATSRYALPFEDPKAADGTPGEEMIYDERCQQIGTEMFYLFSLIQQNRGL